MLVRSLFTIIACIGILVSGHVPSVAQATQSSTTRHPEPEEVDRLLKRLAARKATESWHFEVGSTEAVTFSRSTLTGAEPAAAPREGLPSEEMLTKRRRFAIRALRLYARTKSRLGIKQPVLDGEPCRPRANAFSWHSRGYVFPAGNQNIDHAASCGSCWAFAPIGALESSYAIENGVRANASPRPVDPSEQRLLNCTPDSSCGLGYVYKALDYLVKFGTLTRTELGGNYLASRTQCLPVDKVRYHAVAWGPVITDSKTVAPTSRIKDVLCTFGPVTSRIMVTDSFVTLTGREPFHQPDPVTVNDGNAHHLIIVGWDDTKGEKGAWLVKNSWGDQWGMKEAGMQGFAWVEYGANLIGHHANWVLALHDDVPISAMEPQLSKLKAKYLPK